MKTLNENEIQIVEAYTPDGDQIRNDINLLLEDIYETPDKIVEEMDDLTILYKGAVNETPKATGIQIETTKGNTNMVLMIDLELREATITAHLKGVKAVTQLEDISWLIRAVEVYTS